jgi:hydroxyacylglutathione hydrolase
METHRVTAGGVAVDLISSGDNYIHLVCWGDGGLVVDPAEAAPVEAALAAAGWCPGHILATHHHADHVGGIPALTASTGAEVLGPAGSGIAGLDRGVGEGDVLAIGPLRIEVLATPGHTADHLSYHAAAPGLLFCGDTLFGAGCGRLFECGPAVMWTSLQRLAALPDKTLVFCGHEYTVKNLRFAASILPDDAAIAARLAEAVEARRAGHPTLPSTLGLEKRTNPFLRSGEPAVATALNLEGAPAGEIFAALRRRRDQF